ncbi:MAG TPA: hypothetical protein VD771_03440 [Gemmatimonadaceae bacterium]|nr:hypothetical protein [Gemmatimonadaceae bacterium]
MIGIRKLFLAILSLSLLQPPLGSGALACGSHMREQPTDHMASMAHQSGGDRRGTFDARMSALALTPTTGCGGQSTDGCTGTMRCSLNFCPVFTSRQGPVVVSLVGLPEDRYLIPAVVDTSPDFPPPRNALL